MEAVVTVIYFAMSYPCDQGYYFSEHIAILKRESKTFIKSGKKKIGSLKNR